MKTVGDVMNAEPTYCSPSTSVTEAAQIMRDRDIGDVLVVDNDRLVGIVTERDIVVRGVAGDIDAENLHVEQLARLDPIKLKTSDDSDSAAALMREYGIRRVPVCNDRDEPVGIVSLGDLAEKKDPLSAY